MPEEFVKIYSTNRKSDISLVKSMFEAHNIEYFITSENFSTIYGIAMDVMVGKDSENEAREILSGFLEEHNDRQD